MEFSENKKSDFLSNQIEDPEKIESQILENLKIKEEIKIVIRKQLDLLQDEQDCTISYKISQFPIDGLVLKNKNVQYFGYKSIYDKIQDYGWGCAWRAIQMVLSGLLDQVPSFDFLYYNFGNKYVLESLYQKGCRKDQQSSQQIQDQKINSLLDKKFSPHELESGWAEPLICYCVLEYYEKKSFLYKVNDFKMFMNAPEFCFSKVLTPLEFLQKIEKHFLNSSSNAPIMIDDGTWAKVIIGAKKENGTENYLIWIADPHIYQNNTEESQNVGIYSILVNSKGELVQTFVQKNQYFFFYKDGKSLCDDFSVKSWMVCIPEQ